MSEPGRRHRIVIVAAVTLAAVGVAVLLVASTSPSSGSQRAPGELLPDLDPVAPSSVGVVLAGSSAQPRWRLGFRSATENLGKGPLIVNAMRMRSSQPTMSADQVIATRGGARSVNAGVGRLRFVQSPDHRHWHLLRFMRYELRTAEGHRLVRPDRKTGFCLGDRYEARADRPRKPRRPVFTQQCDLDHPESFEVREGISVGYGDDYAPQLEGQYIDITGLPAGRYTLVHRVNADGRLRERTRRNNAASALLELTWSGPGGVRTPGVVALATCPDTERCS